MAAALPPGPAATLSEAAGNAFTTAMNVVAGVDSLIVIGLMLTVAVVLRTRKVVAVSSPQKAAASADPVAEANRV